ncbi:MAG TPA: DUF2089 domain-containing protein [Halanaerobiales bacterium]|nr:DUF2089 domain-containing protein [Halanaerobiales bacterium]
MKHTLLGKCPVCGDNLIIKTLKCSGCGTEIKGKFKTNRFSRLKSEQLDFVEVFIKCRGNIKDVEKELGISYPTVRNKLDEVIFALGYRVDKHDNEQIVEQRKEILTSLEKGEISSQEAIKRLQKL